MRPAITLFASASLLALASAEAAQTQQALQGTSLSLRNIVATVDVKVVTGTTGIQIALDGEQGMIDRVSYASEGDKAVVSMRSEPGVVLLGSEVDLLRMTVTLAPGTALDTKGFFGTATVGDLDGPVALDTNSGDITVGRVASAAIDIAGSGNVTLGDIKTSLAAKILGSGDLKTGAAGATALAMHGSGDADIQSVAGGLTVSLTGSGDAAIDQLDGPTQIKVSGSGDVVILNGRANPLAISSSGSGDVLFIGTASNAQIATSGSGGVCLSVTEGATALAGDNITVDPNACRAEADD